jgi:hypothetical protein
MLRLQCSLGLSRRKARPMHRESNPKAQEAQHLGEIVAAHIEAKHFGLWSQDEARVG